MMQILFTVTVLIITVILISLHSWDVIKKLYKGYYENWESIFMIALLIIYLMLFLFCLAHILDIAFKYYYFIKLKNNPPWPLNPMSYE